VLPTIAFLEILSALEVGETLAGMGAVAYTTTAWAFDDPIPGYPQRIKNNLRMNGMADKIGSRERAWQRASQETLHHLADLAKKERVSTRSLKIALRGAAGDDRQALCRLVLKGQGSH